MPEYYNDPFYDALDDLNQVFSSTIQNMQEKKGSLLDGNNISTIKHLLSTTPLQDSLPILDYLIASISSSLLEEYKVYSDIEEKVQMDKAILEECRSVIIHLFNNLENGKQSAAERGMTLIDYLEIKLSDNNILILDTFYS